jgi:PAS domain S-box-containing protein
MKLFEALTRPSVWVQDADARHRARLVSALLLALTAMGVLALASPILAEPGRELVHEPAFWIQLILLVMMLAGYGLSRSRYYVASIRLTIGIIWVGVFGVVASLPPSEVSDIRGFLAYLLIPIFLAGMLMALKAVIRLTIITIGALFIFSRFVVVGSPSDIMYSAVFITLMSGILSVFIYFRDLRETARQAQLMESEHRYRQIVEHGGDILLTVDASGYFTYISPASEKLTGYREIELIGKHYLELVAPDWHEQLQQFYEVQIQQQADEMLLDFPIITRSGELRWVEQVSTLLIENSVVKGIQSTVRDVTERKRAEEALVRERTMLRTVIDNVPDAIYFKDTKSRFTLINKALAHMLGISYTQDAIGKTDMDFQPSDLAKGFFEEEQQIIQTGMALFDRLEYNPTRQGKPRWITATKVPVLDVNGDIVGIVGISRDITERKQAEESLRISQGRWRSLAENIPGIITNIARDGTVLYINRVRMHDSVDSVIGSSIYEAILPEYREMAEVKINKVFETGNPDEYELHGSNETGDIMWFRVQIAPVWVEGIVDSLLLIAEEVTARKQAEDALRTSENRFRTMSEVSPLGIFLTDPDGKCLYVNLTCQHIMGVSFDEALGVGWGKYVHPDDVASVFAEWDRARSAEAPFEMIYRFVRKDGEIVWANVKSAPMSNGNTILGYVGTVDDITKRKEDEQTLAEERNLLRTLIDNLPDFVYAKDLEGRLLLDNISHAHAIGQTTSSVVGKTDFELFPTDMAEKFAQDDRIVLQTGQPIVNREEISIRDNGKLIWSSTTKVPLRSRAGDIIGLVGVSRDITERKQSEEALGKERNLLRTLIDNLPDSVYVKDLDGKILLNNITHARGFDMPAEEVVGKTDYDLFLAEEAELYTADDRMVFETGEPLLNKEEFTNTSEGDKRWVATTKVPLRNARGEVIGLVGVTRNITERKKSDEALRLARDQALEASRLKSEFLATMSHEIRTPMNGIMGMTELLLNTSLDDEQRDYAGIALGEARALLTIINDILDFSKIEAGKMVLETIDFDLNETLNRVMAFIRPKADDKGLKLSAHVEAGVPTSLRGDPGRLRQVLLNLVGNAIKFTRKGSVTIHVGMESQDNQSTVLCFLVKDTGIGLSEVARKRLFQPFTQADGSTTRQYGGTGLGLVISKRLAELMGGEIGVESEEGHGATFWFTARFESGNPISLPLLDDDDDMPTDEYKPDCLVLIAEDNPVNQSLALKQMRQLGYRARLVGNGVEALDEVVSYPGQYTLILMDCHMPVMDGYEATRLIRQNEVNTGRHVPIIAMTANAMQGDREKCLAAGMDDYLSKPVSLDVLRDVLKWWLS